MSNPVAYAAGVEAPVQHSIKGADEMMEDAMAKAAAKIEAAKKATSFKSALFCCYCSMWTSNAAGGGPDKTVLFAFWDCIGSCLIFLYGESAFTIIAPRALCKGENECISCAGKGCNCVGRPLKIQYSNCECLPIQCSGGYGIVPCPKTCCFITGNCLIFNYGCALPCTKEVPCEVGLCGFMCMERKAKGAVGAGGDDGPPGNVMTRDTVEIEVIPDGDKIPVAPAVEMLMER